MARTIRTALLLMRVPLVSPGGPIQFGRSITKPPATSQYQIIRKPPTYERLLDLASLVVVIQSGYLPSARQKDGNVSWH